MADPLATALRRRYPREDEPLYGFYPHLDPKVEGKPNTLDTPEHRAAVAEAFLGTLPGSGEALSARDAWDASGRAGEALLAGRFGEAASGYGDMALGTLGAIPGAGIIARGTKRGAAWMDRNVPVWANRLLDAMTPKDPKNTTFIFGGPTARTADHQALARAREMKAAGASRDEIWHATGWDLDKPDGVPRFEIDDSASKLTGENYIGGGITTFEGLDHPELRAAYPETPSFYGQMEPGKRARGSWGPQADPQIQVYAPNAEEARSVSLHEYQHPIQRIEGFSEGALPENAPGFYDLKSEWLAENPGKTLSAGDLYGLQEEAYRRAAGEVEARNVQARMNMSAAERRATPPWLTQDVPDDRQIVRLK
mgnify:CR=1 FL=1